MPKFFDKLVYAVLALIVASMAFAAAATYWWQIALIVILGLGAYIGVRRLWRRFWRWVAGGRDDDDRDDDRGIHIHIHHE